MFARQGFDGSAEAARARRRLASATRAVVVAVIGFSVTFAARSVGAQAVAPTANAAPPPAPPAAGPAPVAPVAAPPASPPASAQQTPTDATGSLKRVRASYEYGDIDDVVEWARPVAEGRLPGTPAERAHALRYLGIGLYLTGRVPGAEAAFFELLRLRADSTLDPRTTRPDVVTFFEQVRARHADEIHASARENNHKIFVLNFLPPVGQFQNGDRGKGLVLAGVELASLATALTSFALLTRWQHADLTADDYSRSTTMKAVHYASWAAFFVAYGIGVLDAIGNYSNVPDEAPPTGPRVALTPSGLALTF
jgi:hypothetical protein